MVDVCVVVVVAHQKMQRSNSWSRQLRNQITPNLAMKMMIKTVESVGAELGPTLSYPVEE